MLNNFNALKKSLLTLTVLNNDFIVLDFGNILVQRNYKNLKIPKLITGGCANVDLNYADFIGEGMLIATVFGDVDIHPPANQILHTIRELLTNSDGVLMVIRECERFTFDLAYQQAIGADLPVKMLIIDDDWNRFVVVAKILGAMAGLGRKLDEIHNFYNSVLIHRIISVKIDGICERTHCKRLKLNSIKDLDLEANTAIVALFNRQKLTKFDELQVINQIIDEFQQRHVSIVRFYLGNFAKTQTECLTILTSVNPEILEFLDYPTSAECWRQVRQSSPLINPPEKPITVDLPHERKGPNLSEINAKNLETTLLFACEALISCETQLNTIDFEESKGNIGTRFRTVAEILKTRIEENTIITNNPYNLLKSLSILLENTIKGKMGSIYGILLESASEQFKQMPENQTITPHEWLVAIATIVDVFKRICNENRRLTTMYFPLYTFYSIANEEYCKTENFIYSFNLATYGGEKAAEKTKLSHREYPDSGAHAVGIWLRAVYEGVKFTCYSGG